MEVRKLLEDIDNSTRFESQNNMAGRFKKFFGDKNYYARSLFAFDNIDQYVNLISRAKKTDAYIARTLSSILQKTLKNGWFFESSNPKKSKIIEERFNELLYNSNLTPRLFLRDVLKNYIDYSNVFIHKTYKNKKLKNGAKSEEKEISAVTLFPARGWAAKETTGPMVTTWEYQTYFDGRITTYSHKDVYHLTYNKEIDDIFGTPFILSVIEDVQLLRDLEGSALEDYFQNLVKKTIVYVGNDALPGTEEEINNLSNYLRSVGPDEDLVLSGRCKVQVLETQFQEPNLIMDSLQKRIFAGLMASETQMGISGAGRQDADTQSQKEIITVEEFQENLEDQLNNTLIREICLEEFGNFDGDNVVLIKFGKSFDQAERVNNHYSNLFQTGAIDFAELRQKIQMPELNFSKTKSFQSIKQKFDKEMVELQGKISKEQEADKAANAAKLAKSKTQPSNQHGTKSTSKPSVKN